MTSRNCIIRIMLRTLCALALMLVGFSHQVPAYARSTLPVDIASFALPDGSLPDLCLPGDDDAHKGKAVFDTGCEACRIASAILLPAPSDTVGIAVRHDVAEEFPWTIVTVARRLVPPNAAPHPSRSS